VFFKLYIYPFHLIMALSFIIRSMEDPSSWVGPPPQGFVLQASGPTFNFVMQDIFVRTGVPVEQQVLAWGTRLLLPLDSVESVPALSVLTLRKVGSPQRGTLSGGAPAVQLTARTALPVAPDEACCVICLEAFTSDFPPVTLRCCHGFHEPCVREWTKQSSFCPLCRNLMELMPALSAAAVGVPGGSGGPGLVAYPVAAAAAGGSLLMMLSQATRETPSAEAIGRLLAATRRSLAELPEFSTLLAAVGAMQNSGAGRIVGMGMQLAGAAALTMALSSCHTNMGSALAFLAPGIGTALRSTGAASSLLGAIGSAGAAVMAAQMQQQLAVGGQGQQQQRYAPQQQAVSSYGPASGGPPPSTGGTWSPGFPPKFIPNPPAAYEGIGTYGAGYADPEAWTGTPPPPRPPAGPGVVRCPTCSVLIKPPQGAPLFRCPCGALLAAPVS
jgi:hypothetical protein